MVISDEVDDFLAGFPVRASLLFDAQIAETFAATQAVHLALEAEFFQIHLEGDCFVVVQAVNRNDPCMSCTRTLIAKAKQLLNLCSVWKASSVCKECKSVAHCLVKL